MKRIFALVMVFTMIVTTSAMAETTTTTFKDVSTTHWAYDAIELMAGKGIINGDGGYFRPNDTVSRAEFAKMLVLTLDLDLVSPSTASFTDVSKSDWEFKYVETAKNYLTGFTSGSGYKFKPDEASVREDMAVAVVKGLFAKGEVEDPDSTNLGILNSYSDQGSISTNLRKYVAAAINEGIMVGSGGVFSPMGNLTRAEAATLLARLIDAEQKVVFDDGDKVVVGDEESDDATLPVVSSGSKTPVLSKDINGDQVDLSWSQVAEDDFKYYKVVLSKYDKTPQYSDNGYMEAISNNGQTSTVVKSGLAYYGNSDFGSVTKGGDTYYMAITAVYSHGNYTSNVVQVTLPGTYVAVSPSEKTPSLTASTDGDEIDLDWSQTASEGFKYYKVVLSEGDSTPQYSEDGYAKAISSVSSTSWDIESGDGYNGGDMNGVIKGGKTYYVAITAVYSDGKYTSNVKRVTIPGSYTEVSESDMTPSLSYTLKDSGVKLDWTSTPSSGFSYYKVVLSQTKENPYYPDYGYATYISDASNSDYYLQEGQSYNDGSKGGIGGQVEDEGYYVTITAVYSSGKYTSNSVYVTVPDK